VTVATDYLLGLPTQVPVAAPAQSTNGNQWSNDQNLAAAGSSKDRKLYSLVLFDGGNHPNGYTITTYGVTGALTYVETDYYVASTNYGTFTVAVPMYLTPAGPELAALPALSPYTPSATSGNDGLDYHILPSYIAPTQPMVTATQDWATAYVNGSPSLFSVMQPVSGANYTSLTGFKLISSTSIGEVPGTGNYGNYVYERARLVMASTSANGVTLTMDYDLMLQEVTQQPTYRVVAWGPAGSAASLVPYQTNLSS
jgi:hypothetical protein